MEHLFPLIPIELFMSSSKKTRKYACRTCGKIGHNSRTCGAPKKVYKRTGKRGRPVGSTKPVETRYPGIFELLGKVTDGVLAEKYNVSRQTIYNIRKANGIPGYYKRKNRMSEVDPSRLGTEYDSVIAEELGVHVTLVAHHRRKLGIPSKQETDRRAIDEKIEKHYDLLGKVTDSEIAEMCGVRSHQVYSYRKARNIETAVARGWHSPQCIGREKAEERIAALFKEEKSDKEIAEELGLHSKTVQGYRCKMGLYRLPRVTEADEKRILKSYRKSRSYLKTVEDTGWSYNAVRRVVENNQER